MTEYEIETALENWLGAGEIVDIDKDLRDFMVNVIDAADDGSMPLKERLRIEGHARDWIERRAVQDAYD